MTGCTAVRAAVTAVTLLVVGAGTLRAQRLDTTLAVTGQPRLSVNNLSGTIVIRSWSRGQVRIQAEYDRADVVITRAQDRISVRTETHRGDNEVDYTISVPRGTSVEVSAVSSDVHVSDVCGSISLNTTSGDVDVTCIDGDSQIQTVSGDVTVSNARARHLEVGSTSGDVVVRDLHGSLATNAVSGDLTLTDIVGDEVTAETVSGDVQYDGAIQDNGRYSFEAHSGDITVRVPSTMNATVTVSTFNGDFSSDFPVTIQPGPHANNQWEFRQGNGSARIRLNSFNGTINLRRGYTSHEE